MLPTTTFGPMRADQLEGKLSFFLVAQSIAGDGTISWLPDYLESWAPSIAIDRAVHARQPTKVEMKKRLVGARKGAESVLAALDDQSTREFLEIEGSSEARNALHKLLMDMVDRASRAISSPILSTSDGKTPRGRSKAFPVGSTSPKLFCAAIFAEAWMHCRHQLPRATDANALAGLHAYWIACGGKDDGWGERRSTSWRHYLANLKDPGISSVRAECRRHLREHARQATFLDLRN